MTLGLEVVTDDWPHGLRCCECQRPLHEGHRYSKRLESFVGDTPVSVIVCVPCSLVVRTEEQA